MQPTRTRFSKIRLLLKWVSWIIVVQLVLINISAAIYAYKLTHFYDSETKPLAASNIFNKTWNLIVGPRYYKNIREPEPSFPYKVQNLYTEDSLRLDAWYSAADSVTQCVILFHGLSANKSFIRGEASEFRRRGFNVLMVDFRAHGKSEGNNHGMGVWETEEVRTAFEWARSMGNDRIMLYGISMGAAACIRAVSEGLVKPQAIIAEMPFQSLREVLRSKADNLGFPSEPFSFLVTSWIGIERGYNGFNHQVNKYAENVKCPVLVQWGTRDRYVDEEAVQKVYKSLASPKKKLVIYPDADHESLQNHDPVKWNQEVFGFLEDVE